MAHTFELQLTWTGSTAGPDYSRALTASTAGKPDLAVSSAPGYAGDGSRWNPEDLFGASLGTCHALTFLSLAAKFGLEVRDLQQQVTVTLDTVERVTKITQVTLSPTITLAAGPTVEKVRDVWEKAHKYCFVANSITAEVLMPPAEVVFT